MQLRKRNRWSAPSRMSVQMAENTSSEDTVSAKVKHQTKHLFASVSFSIRVQSAIRVIFRLAAGSSATCANANASARRFVECNVGLTSRKIRFFPFRLRLDGQVIYREFRRRRWRGTCTGKATCGAPFAELVNSSSVRKSVPIFINDYSCTFFTIVLPISLHQGFHR